MSAQRKYFTGTSIGGSGHYAPEIFLNLNVEISVFLHILEGLDGVLTYSKHLIFTATSSSYTVKPWIEGGPHIHCVSKMSTFLFFK